MTKKYQIRSGHNYYNGSTIGEAMKAAYEDGAIERGERVPVHEGIRRGSFGWDHEDYNWQCSTYTATDRRLGANK